MQLLSPYLEIISRKPSPFANLKSLNIYPVEELRDDDEEEPEKVNMSIKVKNYLLNNSSDSSFTIVSREVFTFLHPEIYSHLSCIILIAMFFMSSNWAFCHLSPSV